MAKQIMVSEDQDLVQDVLEGDLQLHCSLWLFDQLMILQQCHQSAPLKH